MNELKCPECAYLNPDIRGLGYKLPYACLKCDHVWRLQDLGEVQSGLQCEDLSDTDRLRVAVGLAEHLLRCHWPPGSPDKDVDAWLHEYGD